MKIANAGIANQRAAQPVDDESTDKPVEGTEKKAAANNDVESKKEPFPNANVVQQLAGPMSGTRRKSTTEDSKATDKDNTGDSKNTENKDNTGNKADKKIDYEKQAKDNNWTPIERNSELPPMSAISPERQGEDVITYNLDGETYSVSKEVSPFKYSQLDNKVKNIGIQQTDDNINVDLPNSSATDFMAAKTTDDDKTVAQLFKEDMKEEWEDLETDDPRREYLDLFQVKSAMTGGLHYLPNQTHSDGNASDTKFADSELIHTASLYGLVDEEGVHQRLGELADMEPVRKGTDKLMQGAVDKIEDKDGLTDKIFKTMMSDEYGQFLQKSQEGAETRFQNDLQSLTQLDPDKAEEVREKLIFGGSADSLNKMVENREYSDEALEIAVRNEVKTGLAATTLMVFGNGAANTTIQNHLAGKTDDVPKHLEQKLQGFKEAENVLSNALVDSIKQGTPDGQADMQDVMKRVAHGIEDGVSGGAAVAINSVVKSGVIPTMGAVLPTLAAGYSMLSKGDERTKEDKMGEARMLLTMVAAAPDFANTTVGKILDKPGMASTLGLDGSGLEALREPLKKALPDAFKKEQGKPSPSIAKPIELDNFPEQHGKWSGDVAMMSGGLPSKAAAQPGDSAAVTDLFDGASEAGDIDTKARVDRETGFLNLALDTAIEDLDPKEANQRFESWFDELSESEGFGTKERERYRSDFAKVFNDEVEARGASGSGNSGTDTPSIAEVMERINNGNPYNLEGGRQTMPGTAEVMSEVNEDISAAQARIFDERGKAFSGSIDKLDPANREQVLERVNKDADKKGVGGTPNDKLKYVGTAMGIAGAIADTTGGALDIALGGIGIDKLRKEGKDPQDWPAAYAQASLGIIGGTVTIGAAGTGLAASVVGGAAAGATLGVAAGALGLGGVAIGAISLGIMEVVKKEQQENANEDTQDLFANAQEHGMMEENYGEKLNYLQHAQHEYDFDNQHVQGPFPNGTPVWESQPDQYDDFTDQVEKDGNISPDWFSDWHKDNPDSAVANINDSPTSVETDPSGNSLLGGQDSNPVDEKGNVILNDDGTLPLDDSGTLYLPVEIGTFDDFKEDIDKVDMDSIQLLDGGRVSFRKDGSDQVIDPLKGGKTDRRVREDIAGYLTRLHNFTHPDGEFDAGVADRIQKIHGRTDDYNELDALDAFLNPESPDSTEEVPEDEALPDLEAASDVGTYADFKEDIDKVDMASIRRDKDDKDVIYFKKDGMWQKLNKNSDSSSSSSGDVFGANSSPSSSNEDIFSHLVQLHDIVRPNGELNEDIARKVDDVFGRTDDYNDIERLQEHLDEGDRPDVNVVELDGTFGDFVEDVDRIDVGSIQLRDNGRVEFRKDGVVQLIDPNVGGKVNEKAVEYLTELHELANPNGEYDEAIGTEMDEIFGRNDDNNSVEEVREALA